jgi:hypothetical protein
MKLDIYFPTKFWSNKLLLIAIQPFLASSLKGKKRKKNVLLVEKHFHTCNSSDVFVLDFHGQASWGHEATGWHKAKVWRKNGFIFPLSTYSGDTFGA